MNAVPHSPADRLLNASLIGAPILYLVANVLYALRGWESDSAGGIFHVLGAVAFTLVLVRVATWTSGTFAAALLVVGSIGIAGNVAYGFDAIHVALGDVSLVDRDGAATLIKPLGLAFPLTLLMSAVALRNLAPRWTVILIGLAALVFPIANIANIPAVGIVDSIATAVGFGVLAVRRKPAPPADDGDSPVNGPALVTTTP